MKWFRRNKSKLTPEQQEDNAVLNAKNRQLKALSALVEDQAEMLENFGKSMRKYQKQSTEDKVVDTLINFAETQFIKKPSSQTTLESGKRLYSDEEIKEQLLKIPGGYLKKAVEGGQESFVASVKNNVSDISDESAFKSFEIARVLINER